MGSELGRFCLPVLPREYICVFDVSHTNRDQEEKKGKIPIYFSSQNIQKNEISSMKD